MLKQSVDPTTLQDQETKWDARAQQFNALQQRDAQTLPQAVSHHLHTRFPNAKSVLDVGGGSGRYALHFARWAEHILMTDISGKMIDYAAANAKKAHLSNIAFKKLDWYDHTQTERIQDKFDIVFASMSPAASTIDGIEKMIMFSKGHCAVHQFILSEDTLRDFIVSTLSPPSVTPRYDPHNDRQMVQDLFNMLWDRGYSPEVKCFSSETTQTISLEVAKDQYAHTKFSAEFGMANVLRTIEAYAEGGFCHVTKRSVSALVSWSSNPAHHLSQGEKNV